MVRQDAALVEERFQCHSMVSASKADVGAQVVSPEDVAPRFSNQSLEAPNANHANCQHD